MAKHSEHLDDLTIDALIVILKQRFLKNMERHERLSWETIESVLMQNPESLNVLLAMEKTGGEPDVVGIDEAQQALLFYDCAAESPIGRRSYCYDEAALIARKKHKPTDSALNVAEKMGISLLSEEEYAYLQTLGTFDVKTSSWLATPQEIRDLGGALFGDKRYNRTFTYHNGADSYYASRGFRGKMTIPYS